MQGKLRQTKVYYKIFFSVSKEASHKPLKVAAAKKSFPNVFINDTICFDECFLFYVIIGNSIFTQIYRNPRSAFYVRYLHNNITRMLIPKVQNKDSTS